MNYAHANSLKNRLCQIQTTLQANIPLPIQYHQLQSRCTVLTSRYAYTHRISYIFNSRLNIGTTFIIVSVKNLENMIMHTLTCIIFSYCYIFLNIGLPYLGCINWNKHWRAAKHFYSELQILNLQG